MMLFSWTRRLRRRLGNSYLGLVHRFRSLDCDEFSQNLRGAV